MMGGKIVGHHAASEDESTISRELTVAHSRSCSDRTMQADPHNSMTEASMMRLSCSVVSVQAERRSRSLW